MRPSFSPRFSLWHDAVAVAKEATDALLAATEGARVESDAGPTDMAAVVQQRALLSELSLAEEREEAAAAMAAAAVASAWEEGRSAGKEEAAASTAQALEEERAMAHLVRLEAAGAFADDRRRAGLEAADAAKRDSDAASST